MRSSSWGKCRAPSHRHVVTGYMVGHPGLCIWRLLSIDSTTPGASRQSRRLQQPLDASVLERALGSLPPGGHQIPLLAMASAVGQGHQAHPRKALPRRLRFWRPDIVFISRWVRKPRACAGTSGSRGAPCQARNAPVPKMVIGRTGYCQKKMFARPPRFSSLLKLLKRRGRSQEDAEDLIQEAFLRLMEYCRTESVRDEAGFLQRTVMNLSIDRHRVDSRHPTAAQCVEEFAEILVDHSPTPEQVLAAEQRLEEVRRALNAAGPKARDIYLAHRAGYKYGELATIHGVSVSTIEKYVARAVIALMDMKDSLRGKDSK
jgi:RNA polymerase sigma factor (sigma-70 family)